MTVTLYHDTARWVIDPEVFFDPKHPDGVPLTRKKKLIEWGFTDPLERNAVALDTIGECFVKQVTYLKDNIRALEAIGHLNKKQVACLNQLKKEHSNWYKLLTFYDEMSKKYNH